MNRRSEAGTSATMKIIDFTLYVVTFAAIAALALTYFAPHVNPNRTPWFAFLGLAAPVVYLANLLLMLYWTIRWRRIAVMLGVVLLAGIGNVSKFWRPEWSKHYQQPVAGSSTLRLLSYNIGGFQGEQNGVKANRLEQIAAYIREVNPDVICLQEYEFNPHIPEQSIDAELAAWPYKTTVYTLGNEHASYGWGLAIYSKYPLAKRQNMHFPKSTNSALWADVIMHRDTVRVFNVHLQTTQIDGNDREFIGYEMLTDTLRNHKAMGIARKLKRNFQIRADQADSVAQEVHDGYPRVIVCGDFNDTPMSYSYQTVKGDLIDAFRRKGRGVVFTYKGLFSALRIDYIFHSRAFETISYEAARPEWSDHNPVIVDIKLKNK